LVPSSRVYPPTQTRLRSPGPGFDRGGSPPEYLFDFERVAPRLETLARSCFQLRPLFVAMMPPSEWVNSLGETRAPAAALSGTR
jgi:hypothetical protein